MATERFHVQVYPDNRDNFSHKFYWGSESAGISDDKYPFASIDEACDDIVKECNMQNILDFDIHVCHDAAIDAFGCDNCGKHKTLAVNESMLRLCDECREI